ncbi:PAS domain S-box protein [Candidatus Bathyarchaeota archaeon]|nr:MAG: PAS domain S-box protein [Candidatus Bathyarchaeota archaeon]
MAETRRRGDDVQPALAENKESLLESSTLAAIVQSSQDAIIGKDLKGIITSWNHGAEVIYGYSAKEAVGKPISMLVPPGRHDEIPEILERVKKGESVEHFETTRITKDGKTVHLSLTISPIRDKAGRIIGASTIARDITARRKIDEERLRLAAIVESSEDAILGLNLDGTVTSWNVGAEKMFGFHPSEVIGKSVRVIYPIDRPDELPEIIKKIKLGQRIDHYETKRKRKDGTIIDVSLSISAIKNDLTEVIGISKIIRDISGQKQASQYARSLIEASLDPLVTISPDGKITDVNEATVQVTGTAREKLIGSDFSNYFTEPEKAREGYRQVLSKGKVTDYPLTIRHVSGKTLDVLYNATVYRDDKGNVLGVFAAARDITAQRQASQYARSLIEASLDPLVTINPDGKIMDVNEATIQVTGVSRERLVGSDFSSYFTDPEEARLGYEQAFKEGSVRDYPLAIRHVSGMITHVLYNATVYRDADANVLGVFAAARDTTERKKAEDQLHATSAYARSLIEASLDPLVTISPEGKITDVNHATELITGVSREWLTGTDFSNYFTEPRKAREGYRKVFKEGFVKDYPLAIRHSSGRVADVFYNATVYRDAAGKVRGVFAAARDVTDTRKASQYARSLIEASLDPLVTISADGKITDVNDATVRVTGVPRQLLIGTDFSNYFIEPQKARDGYQQVFKEGFVKDYPLTIRSTTGKLTDVLYNASVYRDDKGNVLGIFAAARDVTVGKQVTQQLEASNRELEAFTYSVSHDLRAPLRAIDGFSKILLDDYSRPLGDEGKRMLSVIRKNVQQMAKLIDDLLTLSRLGRTEVRTQDVEMSDMVNDVLKELKQNAPNREIEFKIHPLPNAEVDPALFRQVWINLLSNAVKFTGKKERPKIEVGSNREKNQIVYYVKDNGVGFSMEYSNKLFRVFERLHSEEDYEGSGVGLAIVHRIVTRHNGQVWAEGKVGEGATFFLSVPIKE